MCLTSWYISNLCQNTWKHLQVGQFFYHTMHYSTKRGIAEHVVCLSVCDAGGSGPHRVEIMGTNYIGNSPNTFALHTTKAIHLFRGKHGKFWRVGKSGMQEYRSGNISEMRKDKGEKLANTLANATIPDPLCPPLPQDWGFATAHPKFQLLLSHSQGPSEQKPI